jgi:uncharacterized protein (TIGR00266 family)
METIQNQKSEFEFKIEGAPDYAYLEVKIPTNTTLKVEAAAMATMDTNIEMKTKMTGGLGRLFTGENLFINEFMSRNSSGTIGIAPSAPGDIKHQYMQEGDVLFLQNSAYVASGLGVKIETKFQGLTRGFFSGEGLFLVKCTGQGDLFFNSFGAIIPIDVKGDYVVDTGHIVAFTGGLDYQIKSIGGMKSLFFSGEGLVATFSGEGTVWIQTKKFRPLLHWANPFRPSGG